MFANAQLMGIDFAFPDVCLTPVPPSPAPVPMPYPNISMGPTMTGFVPHVLWMCTPGHNLSTIGTLSNGDNAGIGLGVASGTVMGPARHLNGAFTVKLGGMPATRMTSATLQNSTNASGMRIIPSQFKVLIFAP